MNYTNGAGLALAQIAKDLPDELAASVSGDGGFVLQRLSTDTRSIEAGDVFLALRGPNHDGHDHVSAAVAAGASALIVERVCSVDIPQLIVKDTRLALGRIAALWCLDHPADRVAITGSNGKTTVKEMVAAILAKAALRQLSEESQAPQPLAAVVHATDGNFNNDIGLPLTCLGIAAQHRYAVLEVGTSAPGEIAYLTAIARPRVALVNNIAPAHLEGFGSIGNVAIEKASIFAGLDAQGVAVMPAGSKHMTELRQASAHCRQLTFGTASDADVQGEIVATSARVRISRSVDFDVAGNLAGSEFEISLRLLGRHNYLNALAAIAVCLPLAVTVEDMVGALAAVSPVPGRLQIREGMAARLIDDTYNANPASLHAAIDLLAEYSGKRVLVLGDMKELGSDELQYHAQAGCYARERGIDSLIAIGTLAAHAAVEFGENAASFADKREVADLLFQHIGENHTVLFKGSRGARIEDVINELLGRSESLSDAATSFAEPDDEDDEARTTQTLQACTSRLNLSPAGGDCASRNGRFARRVVHL